MLEAENYKLILIGIINSIFLGLSNMSHIYNDSTLIKASFTYYGIARRAVGTGGTGRGIPPVFDRSVNPIPGGRLCQSYYYLPPSPFCRIFRPSYVPDLIMIGLAVMPTEYICVRNVPQFKEKEPSYTLGLSELGGMGTIP